MNSEWIPAIVVTALFVGFIALALRLTKVPVGRADPRGEQLATFVDLLAADPTDRLARDQLRSLLAGPQWNGSQYVPSLQTTQRKFLEIAPVVVNDNDGEDLFKWFIHHFSRMPSPAIVYEIVATLAKFVEWPGNEGRYRDVVVYSAATLKLTSSYLKYLYEVGLGAVSASHGTPLAKTQALGLGRLHYATLRPDGKLTLYDEQALANDIAARS